MTQVSLLLCNHVINPNWMKGMLNIRFLPFNIAQDAQDAECDELIGPAQMEHLTSLGKQLNIPFIQPV